MLNPSKLIPHSHFASCRNHVLYDKICPSAFHVAYDYNNVSCVSFSLSLSFMTFAVLKIHGQLFCRMSFNLSFWVGLDLFLLLMIKLKLYTGIHWWEYPRSKSGFFSLYIWWHIIPIYLPIYPIMFTLII